MPKHFSYEMLLRKLNSSLKGILLSSLDDFAPGGCHDVLLGAGCGSFLFLSINPQTQFPSICAVFTHHSDLSGQNDLYFIS